MTPSLEIGVIELVKTFIDIFKKAKDEVYDLFEVGLEESLINQAEKFYYTHNFIYRETKVPFYDVYFPISVGYSKTYFHKPITELETNKYVTIIGVAGSGKSTLSKYIYLNAIKENIKIPLFIELRNINASNSTFEGYINSKILNLKIKHNEDKIVSALKNGHFLFILDGYDEIPYEKVGSFEDQLMDFIDKFKNNHYIITSRPGTSAERLSRFHNYSVNDLTSDEVTMFLKMQLKTKEQIRKMLEVVNSERSKPYLKFLENPLLLSMFIVTFEYFPEIPEHKSEFYKNVFDTLYSKHDGINKNSFSRKRRSGLQRIQFEKLLATISYVTFFKGKFTFEELFLSELISSIQKIEKSINNFEAEEVLYDLVTSISILIKDGLLISFPHRSIQEYFAASFIKELEFEKKSKVYDKLLNIVLPNSKDDFANFIDLCVELDKDGVLSCLIIKVLKTFVSNVCDDKYIYDLCNKFEILIHFQLFDVKARVPFKILDIQPAGNYLLKIIRYFNCNDCFDWLFERISKRLIINKIEKLLLKDGRKVINELGINNRSGIVITKLFDNNPASYKLINEPINEEERSLYLKKPIENAIKKFETEIANNDLAIYKLLDL